MSKNIKFDPVLIFFDKKYVLSTVTNRRSTAITLQRVTTRAITQPKITQTIPVAPRYPVHAAKPTLWPTLSLNLPNRLTYEALPQ